VQILKEAEDPFSQAVLAVEELRRLSRVVPSWDWANTAVIAREWSYLDPVRSYCEAQGIPVQTANADLPNFWRLKETQALVTWLRSRDRSAVHASDLSTWMEKQSDGPWWSILREGVEEFLSEVRRPRHRQEAKSSSGWRSGGEMFERDNRGCSFCPHTVQKG
jgi:ATP-dependent DNA helicase RecQ